MQPTLVVHADWGTASRKRWMACAVRLNIARHSAVQICTIRTAASRHAAWLARGAERRPTRPPSGAYQARAPEPVGDARTLLHRLRAQAGPEGSVLAGFDFPIGLPARYAERAGIDDFRALLPQLGQGEWRAFYDVAERPDQISLHRPFYPYRPGGTSQRQLLDGLGLVTRSDLLRRCEQARPGRGAAAPLFWTLGAQQAGKAAIAGWREVLGPGLRAEALDVALWPFDGELDDLLRPGRIVLAETYPAECYTHLGIAFPRRAGRRTGKRVQAARADNAPHLLAWAEEAQVQVAPALREQTADGFGPSPDGEDPFDAVVGLLGMLNVVLGRRSAGAPEDAAVRRVEGWILGQEETKDDGRTTTDEQCSRSVGLTPAQTQVDARADAG